MKCKKCGETIPNDKECPVCGFGLTAAVVGEPVARTRELTDLWDQYAIATAATASGNEYQKGLTEGLRHAARDLRAALAAPVASRAGSEPDEVMERAVFAADAKRRGWKPGDFMLAAYAGWLAKAALAHPPVAASPAVQVGAATVAAAAEPRATHGLSASDSACARSVWWAHKKATFTTPRQAAFAAWDAALLAPDRAGVASLVASEEVVPAWELRLQGAEAFAEVYGAQDDWRSKAAAWLRRKADEQERTNREFPKHVEAYPSWTDRPRQFRWLADDLDAEDAARASAGEAQS